MQQLELRDEFLAKHMRGTAIALRNKQNTCWAQKGPEDLLAITYPTSDVQRSLEAISAAMPGKSIVFLGQRGRGKQRPYDVGHGMRKSPHLNLPPVAGEEVGNTGSHVTAFCQPVLRDGRGGGKRRPCDVGHSYFPDVRSRCSIGM